MAFHHTLSLGPLVFPGETACIACLQGRVSIRWGDETPPTSPKVANKYINIVTELISAELDRIAQGDTSLTNKTVSWNFQDRTIKTNQLLKVPLCPICSHNRIDRSGALALPWEKDESITNTV
jgi:bacteriocin biosynthesis cyclodehydratase domain-containing protein